MNAMSERERWIVYPLLFLALGASLRDRYYARTAPRIIECQELHIVDDDDPLSDTPITVAKLKLVPATKDQPSTAFLDVNGNANFSGSANIDGQLIVQNVQIGPTLQSVRST